MGWSSIGRGARRLRFRGASAGASLASPSDARSDEGPPFKGQQGQGRSKEEIATECELDFLVVDPKRGMLGLEVKGGVIRRDESGCFQNERPIRSPGLHAQHAVHALSGYLAKQAHLLAPEVPTGADAQAFWRDEAPKNREKIIEHIDHVVKLVGPDHVGLGSDFDGARMPDGMEDCSKLTKITEALLRRGYREEDIRKILGGNTLGCWPRPSA